MIRHISPPMREATATELEAWRRHGWLHVPDALDALAVTELQRWVDDIAERRSDDAGLMQHYERTAHGVALARSERLVEVHAGWRQLITEGELVSMAGQLLGEPAVLYKEKINYKLAGGAGFAAHQDAPAYPFIDTHLTAMVAIDDANISNGCLEVASAMHAELIAVDDDGCIPGDVADTLDFEPLSVRAGDVLWFHSLVPHRSGPNLSSTTRRALFCTYNAARLGDLRADYYDHKRRYFAERGHGTERVSTIGDFQGLAPSDDELRELGLTP